MSMICKKKSFLSSFEEEGTDLAGMKGDCWRMHFLQKCFQNWESYTNPLSPILLSTCSPIESGKKNIFGERERGGKIA